MKVCSEGAGEEKGVRGGSGRGEAAGEKSWRKRRSMLTWRMSGTCGVPRVIGVALVALIRVTAGGGHKCLVVCDVIVITTPQCRRLDNSQW